MDASAVDWSAWVTAGASVVLAGITWWYMRFNKSLVKVSQDQLVELKAERMTARTAARTALAHYAEYLQKKLQDAGLEPNNTTVKHLEAITDGIIKDFETYGLRADIDDLNQVFFIVYALRNLKLHALEWTSGSQLVSYWSEDRKSGWQNDYNIANQFLEMLSRRLSILLRYPQETTRISSTTAKESGTIK